MTDGGLLMNQAPTSSDQQRLLLERRQLFHGAALTAAGFSLPVLLSACGGGGPFPANPPQWNFVFINHVKDDPFFIPTIYGSQDACQTLGCSQPQWVGAMAGQSQATRIPTMLAAFNRAIQDEVDGIAVSIIDPDKFNDPVVRALDAGIPVIGYNSDAPPGSGNQRQAYIGQDLFLSGQVMGKHILSLVPTGKIVGFIGSPNDLNTKPRMDGVKQAMQEAGRLPDFDEHFSDTDPKVAGQRIDDYYLSHQDVKGLVAVDGSSTAGVAMTMKKHGLSNDNIHAGGYDLLDDTLQAIQGGYLDFAIDQQPYLQGFIPVVQLFLYKVSGGRIQPFDVNTGIRFISIKEATQYLALKTRFEGLSEKQQVVPVSS